MRVKKKVKHSAQVVANKRDAGVLAGKIDVDPKRSAHNREVDVDLAKSAVYRAHFLESNLSVLDGFITPSVVESIR